MEANQEYSLDPGQVRLFAMVVLAMAAEVLFEALLLHVSDNESRNFSYSLNR